MPTRPADTSVDHLEEIEAQIKTLENKVMAKEVLTWLISNVENYIDNTTRYYKIDLLIDNDEFPETRKAQNLYRECGDIYDTITQNPALLARSKNILEKIAECRIILDEITAEAFFAMKEDKEQLNALFKRMVFFYEKIIPNPEAKKRANEIDEELKALVKEKERAETVEEKKKVQEQIVKKIDEGVALVKFTELEGAVDVTKFEYEAFDVKVSLLKKNKNEDKEVINEYNIPEGFTIWLEISQRPKMKRPVAMF